MRVRQSLKPLEACASDQNESPSGEDIDLKSWGGLCVGLEHNFRIKEHGRSDTAAQAGLSPLPSPGSQALVLTHVYTNRLKKN